MMKFYGEIGYAETEEVSPGVWQEKIKELLYFGDILKNVSKSRDGEHLNQDLIFENRLSIIADPFAYANFHSIRYVKWLGAKWQVSGVEVQRPRLILTLGQVYNEQTSEIPSDSN